MGSRCVWRVWQRINLCVCPHATQSGWGEEAEGSGRGAPRHHTPPAFEAAAPQPKQKVKGKTKREWHYPVFTRTTTSGIRYAKANVNNVNGVILLPDDWSSGTYSLSSTNTSVASFSSNMITASQWSTLEQAGAVFLPAAGFRLGTSVSNVGSSGYYWSASYYNSDRARYVSFLVSSLYMPSNYRYGGRSVRLVRVAEN